MKKVVITGSSGRIGRALHWRLCRDYQVIGVDVSPSSATSQIKDIRDYESLLQLFEGVDTVFHAAAYHAPHVGLITENEFRTVNVDATEKICKAAIECGVSQIIFTSTTALYGNANMGVGQAVWVNEQTTPQPRTIYHQTKLDAEHILQSYASSKLIVRVLRMSRCFPEPAPVMAIYRLHRGVDYRDVAEAHLLAGLVEHKKPFDIFVVSGKTPFGKSDRNRLYENPESVIREKCPRLARIFDERNWQFPKVIDRVYDSSYCESSLGWQQKYDSLEIIDQLDRNDFEVLPPV